MLSLALFILALIFSLGQLAYKHQWDKATVADTVLAFILFFNMGVLSLLAAYAHVFLGPETAREIGWQPGSPFQFEIGMANLSYGILGILAFWIRGRFWEAACIGWSVLLLGCFVGHIIDYYTHHNTAPWNIGFYIWLTDLFLPLFILSLLGYTRAVEK